MILCSVCNTPNRPEARFCAHCRVPLNVCPRCSTANRAGAAFCHGCSQKLKVSCPSCGAINRVQASFCRVCGSSLSAPPPPVTPAVRCPVCGNGNRPGARFCLACGSPQASQSVPPAARPRYGTGMLPASTVLRGRYIVLKKIAQGGQGAVYQVGDTRLTGKVWALKEMSESAIAPAERQQAVDAFLREAQLLANLTHPNLPKVVDVFEEQGKQYMIMEFVDGKTLLKLLEELADPMPLDRVLDWAEQLCDVLGYLHSQDTPIVYRDLKPQNVMEVTGSHDVKLIDFGIVRFYKAGKKKDTVMLGTPGYAPPEQYGKGQTDARADVYALGATLHFLLTRRDPATELFKFPSIRSLNNAVPRDVDDAIAKAVKVRPDDRFDSMAEMSQALLGKRKQRVSARPAPAPPQPVPTPIATPIFSMPTPDPTPLATPIFSRPTPDPMPIFTPVFPPLSPIQPAGLTLSDHCLDFGVLEKGSSESRKLHVVLGPGSTGRIHTPESWIWLSPLTLQSGGEDVDVTVHTASLALATGGVRRSVPNWLGAIGRWLRQQSSEGLNGIGVVVLLSPLWLAGLVSAALVQALLWLAYLHALRLVPAPCDYRGRVQVETSAGDDEVEVQVLVRPRRWDLVVGWLKVAAAMTAELAVVALLLAWIVAENL